MQLRDHLMHPSGGLLWHLRALRWRQQWHALQTSLATLLPAWSAQLPAPRPPLLLIGPSAGWTLPLPWLQEFPTVIACEPDPLARCLLRMRARHAGLHFSRTDPFAADGIKALRARHPEAALLFCNVLGQVSPEDGQQAEVWCMELKEALGECAWASYHDLVSTDRAPTRHGMQVLPPGTSTDAAVARFWQGTEITLCDHQTMTLAGNNPSVCIPWPLTPHRWHLVQWISRPPSIPPLA